MEPQSMKSQSIQKRLTDTLYYDGRCALCSREISFLKRHAGGKLAFHDIHLGELPPGHTREALLEVLHLKTEAGDWLSGIDATLRAWSHTPFAWFLFPLKVKMFRPFWDRLYQYWAQRRYCRLYGE